MSGRTRASIIEWQTKSSPTPLRQLAVLQGDIKFGRINFRRSIE